MKKLSLLFAVLAIAASVQAQNGIVKLGLSNVFVKTINLEYEHLLNEQNSILAEIAIQIPRDVPQSYFDRIEAFGTDNKVTFNSGTYNNFYVAAEYRFYTGGNGPKGLYIAPYAKLGNQTFDISGNYQHSTNSAITAAAEVGLLSLSVGGQVGYQWLIQDRFTINWNIVGIGASFNRVKASFTANDNGVFDDFASEAQVFIDNIPGVKNIDLVPDNVNKTIKGAGAFPFGAARVSLSVGYMF